MRPFILSASLLLISTLLVMLIPSFVNTLDQTLTGPQIPLNNSSILAVQKINIPPISRNIPFPNILAKAILIKDLTTGTFLYQKDINTPLPPASTTKVMTALVSSEYFKPNSSLTIKNAANIPGASAGLIQGETLSFRSLLYGMLLPSGNDAAFAIAENYPGSVIGFVSAMNKKAAQLGLSSTHFDNPAGFDSLSHYSSAKDLASVTEEALKSPQLSRIFATKETDIVSLDKKYAHKLYNLNKLLSQIPGVLGIKTGKTALAKENLITLVERDGHKILYVLLGSDDRFLETTLLIDWVNSNFEWAKP